MDKELSEELILATMSSSPVLWILFSIIYKLVQSDQAIS